MWAGTLILTILIIVFAEIAPKNFAAKKPEAIAYPASIILEFLTNSFGWLSRILNFFSSKVTGVKNEENYFAQNLNRDELKSVLTKETEEVDKEEMEAMKSLLELKELTVQDILIPMSEVISLNLEEIESFDNDERDRFYPVYEKENSEVLGFKISDYSNTPISLCFFHINGRHHSLALFGSGKMGFHHFMVEYNSLDDVGQGYDLVQYKDNAIAYTMGRHTNDYMTSFYSITPSGFFVENGWGGRIINPSTWKSHETFEGPSFWGHERLYLPKEERMKFRNKRMETAAEGKQAPLLIDCPWLYSNITDKK